MTDYKNCISFSGVLCFTDSTYIGKPCFCRCKDNTEYECPNFRPKPKYRDK